MDEKTLTTLSETFLRVINRYNEIEKTPYSYGTDTLLRLSEVHTIEAVGNHPDINVTNLANLLGITKGAISKRIQQLRQRGFITKSVAPTTENEVVLRLTAKGEQVYSAHANYSKQLNISIAQLYQGLPQEVLTELVQIGNDTDKLFMNIAAERKKH